MNIAERIIRDPEALARATAAIKRLTAAVDQLRGQVQRERRRRAWQDESHTEFERALSATVAKDFGADVL